jgi:hypothetical protein
MKSFILLIRAILGLHTVYDGTTCEVSKAIWNVHDYHKFRGGDGHPAHFHTYSCPKCGMRFSI